MDIDMLIHDNYKVGLASKIRVMIRRLEGNYQVPIEWKEVNSVGSILLQVLQILCDLVENGCLPLSRQQQVLTHTTERLMDKSAQVRKNAISLLTAFIKQNPFAAKVRSIS